MANLNRMASELAEVEGLKEPISVAQVKEVLGCLGERWRQNPDKADVQEEIAAILKRAGKRSSRGRR